MTHGLSEREMTGAFKASDLTTPESGQDSGPKAHSGGSPMRHVHSLPVIRAVSPSSVVPKIILAPYCVLLDWRVSRFAFPVAVGDVFAGGCRPQESTSPVLPHALNCGVGTSPASVEVKLRRPYSPAAVEKPILRRINGIEARVARA
jgi:hypothetical protein